MSEDLRMKDLQMKGLTEKLEGFLSGFEKSKRKDLDLSDISSKLKEFQIALDESKIELRHIRDEAEKNEYNSIIKHHKQTFTKLKNEYEWKKQAQVKDQLLGDHHEATAADQANPDQLMKYGLEVQDKSKDSLHRTLQTVADAKQVGSQTVEKLQGNTEQVENMYNELENIEGSLARSRKIIARIARKVATDKYVWVVVFLVVCAILAVIILKSIGIGSNTLAPSLNLTSTGGSG